MSAAGGSSTHRDADGGRIFVAGLPVVRADGTRALDMLWADIRDRAATVYVFVNGQSASLRRQQAYRDMLASPDIVPLPDGVPMTLGARLTGQGEVGRCPGPDLLEHASARAAKDGTRFFLLGGGPGVADELGSSLTARHPGLRVVGTVTPPFGEWSEDECRELVANVDESGADVVWLGVSAPKQETWALRWREELGRPTVCVGAAFDFLSGRKARAPLWMRQAGLEWMFRLGSEPRRMWKRYLVGNTVFVGDLVRFRGRPPGPAG